MGGWKGVRVRQRGIEYFLITLDGLNEVTGLVKSLSVMKSKSREGKK